LHQDALPEPILKRCRHVISENQRTLEAAEALRAGELASVGSLMAQSHESLRDDYQVSCRELDLLWEFASSIEGVIGARMTGGGFGGCTVNLVRREALEDFQNLVTEKYQAATGSAPAIYDSSASDGAREVSR